LNREEEPVQLGNVHSDREIEGAVESIEVTKVESCVEDRLATLCKAPRDDSGSIQVKRHTAGGACGLTDLVESAQKLIGI
jgi:hypothetical protein